MFPKLREIELFAFLARRLEVRYATIQPLVAAFQDEALVRLLGFLFIPFVA